tara:strand:- start:4343 stop:5230 length:888 start_codon:yes stop_codon:yes gene_type:complete
MKKLIKNILREQWEEPEPISEKMLKKYFTFIDRVGVNVALPLLGIESTEQKAEVLTKYYSEHPNPKEEIISVGFDANETSKMFSDSDYGMSELVEKYLSGNYEYDDYYECYDFDPNWMMDDLSEEILLFMRKRAIKSVDGDDEDEIMDYIGEMFGSEIGCAFSEAQYDADVNELHKDIDREVESLYGNFKGEWNFNEGVFKTEISISDMAKSEIFGEELLNELEWNGTLDWSSVLSSVMEYEWENIGYSSVFFDEKPYINTDKHFRYGGAGDMDKNYMNEILSDRLTMENGDIYN